MTLAGLVWHGTPAADAIVVTPFGAAATCGASDVRKAVVRFIAAGNRRDRRAIDTLVARDGLFQWFTIEDRDSRRGAGFYRRGRLVRYLAGRRGGASFRLRWLEFNGRGGFYGHFEYRLAVTSPSAHVLYHGKGAVTCTTPQRVAVWSMGNVPANVENLTPGSS